MSKLHSTSADILLGSEYINCNDCESSRVSGTSKLMDPTDIEVQIVSPN